MRPRDLEPFRRQLFCILTNSARDGSQQQVEVDGIVAYGLGLHCVGHEKVNVTHLASGKLVASFSTLGGAIDFVEAVAGMDWRKEPNALAKQDLRKLADEIESKSPKPMVRP